MHQIIIRKSLHSDTEINIRDIQSEYYHFMYTGWSKIWIDLYMNLLLAQISFYTVTISACFVLREHLFFHLCDCCFVLKLLCNMQAYNLRIIMEAVSLLTVVLKFVITYVPKLHHGMF